MKSNLKLKKNRVFIFIIMMFLFTTGLKIENLDGFETRQPEPQIDLSLC